jgi:hypothetical protein
MDNLHREVIAVTATVRKMLADADIGGSFRMEVTVSGRIQEGEVLCEYRIGSLYGETTKGQDIMSVAKEYMRRQGWNESHAPLALPAPDDVESNDQPVVETVQY